MELNISKIPESNKFLVPVASQNMNTDFATDIKTLVCGERKLKVFNHYVYKKGEIGPDSLFFLALGYNIDMDMIWKTFPVSDKIYLFICQEITEQPTHEEKEPEENNELPDLGL
jgi:hypothetical protein